MGTLEMPVWMDNGGPYAAGMDRTVLWGAMPVPGVFAQDCAVAASGNSAPGIVAQRGAGANQSVDISPGRIVVGESGTTNAGWRNYLCKHSGAAVTNFAMPAAPVGGNPRYDALCATVADSTVGGGSNNWTFTVVQGTAAASPAFPTVTGMSTVLAMILRPNANNNVTTANIINCANQLWYEGGTRLAYAKYNAGTHTVKSNSANSFAQIDSTWHATFTVPPSGKVKAVVSGIGGATGVTTAVGVMGLYVAVADASNATPAGAVYGMTSTTNGNNDRVSYESRITGLTPGAVLTWWPVYARGAGAGGTAFWVTSNGEGDSWFAVYADA